MPEDRPCLDWHSKPLIARRFDRLYDRRVPMRMLRCINILRRRLAPELRDETFGKTTFDLVQIWQDQMKHRLDVPSALRDRLYVNGDVDTPTANALNWVLAKLGALRAVKPSSAQPTARPVYRGIPKSVLTRLKRRKWTFRTA
jgi:hypothetical protein